LHNNKIDNQNKTSLSVINSESFVKLPMFSSTCPGWICYAEKSHPEILPLISTSKSAQQIMGILLKNFIASSLSISSSCIYHVTIMPCFDKKLEASRKVKN
jgi:iron only hydrogenase large subunit-like protein